MFKSRNVEFRYQSGPVVLHEHLYNTRTGAVFRVLDKNNNQYALKVFAYSDDLPIGHKERRLYDYATERSTLVAVTKSACPKLLDALSDKSQFGHPVECEDHHLQYVIGLDVPVLDAGKIVSTRKVRLMSSKGEENERQLDFSANSLLPYMAGGRLNDLVARLPKYQSMVVRYPLYVDVAPQMVDAVRYLHSLHIAHLGIQASTILCSNLNCDYAVLSDPSAAWNGQPGSSSPYANELMQQSVRFAQFASPEDTKSSPVTETFAKYLKESSDDWEGVLKVDWYGLGGALFYVLSGIRPVAEDRSGPNSHDAAEFIYKALQSKQLLSQIQSEQAKEALAKVRDQVAEGLLLVDGLLQTDRSKRISFDISSQGQERATKTKSSLRSSKALMSALQVDAATAKKKSTTCSSFMLESTKESPTLAKLPVLDQASLPSFIQDICK
jgi:serine/threonine protein kinase